MTELTITKFGDSLGIVLPKEVLLRCNFVEGDKLYLMEAPDGSIRIMPFEPEMEAQIEAAQKGMNKFRNTLGKLAE